jgi:hypothetical protein
MKKLALTAALAMASLLSQQAFAAPAPITQTSNFDVDINLTTGCVISQAPSTVSFTYTAFATSAQPLDTNGTFKVKCTNNLNYGLTLDSAGAYTDTATNLTYTLSLSGAGAAGNGGDQTYTITGSMAAGQGGSCAASGASCTNAGGPGKTRTLTLTY